MRAVFDLRCLTEPYGTGVAQYTRRILPAMAAGLYQSGDEWVSFTSGAKKIDLPVPAIFKKKHVSSPNSLLNFLVVMKVADPSSWYGSPDIFWQPNPMFTPDVKGKHVVCLHDLSFLHFPAFFHWHTRLWYLRWVREWLKKEHPNVILTAISEFTHNDVLEHFPHWRGRIFVQYQPPPIQRERSDIKPGSSRTILFVGTLLPRKNVLALIDGFNQFAQKHRDYKLRLVGQATRWWQNQKLKLPDNI